MEEMKRNESQSSTNKSTGTISSTNGISSTPTARPPRSEENKGTDGEREGGRSALPVGPLAAQEVEWRPEHEVERRWGKRA